MQIIAVMNQKGGVGKTATTLNLAAGLKERGYKVLVVDIDPQEGNLSNTIQADKTVMSMFEVLCGDCQMAEVIQSMEIFDIVPATIDMANIDVPLNKNGGVGREYRLKEVLRTLPQDAYDFAIIDTPPALNLLATNALTAADYVLAVTDPDKNALKGLTQLDGMIKQVKAYANPNLQYIGVLMTKYQTNTNISKDMKQVAEKLAEMFGTKLFDTVIRTGVAVPSSFTNACPVWQQDPESGPAVDYPIFVSEFVQFIQKGEK